MGIRKFIEWTFHVLDNFIKLIDYIQIKFIIQGLSLMGSLGNREAFLTSYKFKNRNVTLSSPTPNPPWG